MKIVLEVVAVTVLFIAIIFVVAKHERIYVPTDLVKYDCDSIREMGEDHYFSVVRSMVSRKYNDQYSDVFVMRLKEAYVYYCK